MVEEKGKELTVIMYHYVRDLQNSRYPAIKGLDVRLFEKQLAYIQGNFQVIRMEELLEAVETGAWDKLPPRPALLTFDDGYVDSYTVVYPLLKKYGIQGSFFPNAKAVKEHKVLDVNKIHYILAAAPLEELVQDCFLAVRQQEGLPSPEELFRELAIPNRWDCGEVIFVKRLLQNRLPEEVRNQITTALFEKYVGIKEEIFARELYMNEEQIRCMKAGGMFFGLHGYDHYWLGKLSKEEMQRDISKALDYWDGVIDRENWVMNYPYGSYNEEVISYIRANGCRLGFTVEARNANLMTDNPYLLPRWDTNDLPPKGNAILDKGFESC